MEVLSGVLNFMLSHSYAHFVSLIVFAMLRVLLKRREATVRHLFSQLISQLCIYLSVFQVTRLSLLNLSPSSAEVINQREDASLEKHIYFGFLLSLMTHQFSCT